jgi:hypothetical protein
LVGCDQGEQGEQGAASLAQQLQAFPAGCADFGMAGNFGAEQGRHPRRP